VWQADAFDELGHHIYRYDYRQRAFMLKSTDSRDDELINLCKTIKPDVILFSKCNKMDVRVVTECGKIGTTALWYMDPKGNIDKELILKIKASNYVFTSRWDCIREGKRHNNNVYYVHEGYDPKTNYPMDVPKIRDVSFIGNLRDGRFKYHEVIKFDVISNAYREEHALTVSETKINLNLTEGDGTSDRTYKVLAAGGFLLTLPWERMEESFTNGSDLVVFSNIFDLKEKIKYYLHNEVERETIAKTGYQTVKKYDNKNYARTILEVINGQ
jgi:spore maturation protein CgeB